MGYAEATDDQIECPASGEPIGIGDVTADGIGMGTYSSLFYVLPVQSTFAATDPLGSVSYTHLTLPTKA